VQIGVSARVFSYDLLHRFGVMLAIAEPDTGCRLDAAWLIWKSLSGEVPVDAANDERSGHRWLDRG
jgi:hypothetical protein